MFIASQTSPPADHDEMSETTRMIANADSEGAAMDLFHGFAQPGHTVELTGELPNSAWVQEQQKAGKLKPGEVMNYSAPLA